MKDHNDKVKGFALVNSLMPDHLHHTLPFLINRIAATVTDGVNQAFQAQGLNVYAARVLILLHLDGDYSVGELALQASLDQSTLSHILRRLEKQGLVTRIRKELDNRSVLVSLTQEGKGVGAECWKAVQKHDALLRDGLDATSVTVLEGLLERIYKNVPLFRSLQTTPHRLDPTAVAKEKILRPRSKAPSR